MISFRKGYLGFSTLLQAHGSSVPRTLLPALLSSCLTLSFFYLKSDLGEDKTWRHYLVLMMPEWQIYQTFASTTMFLLVFRTQVVMSL